MLLPILTPIANDILPLAAARIAETYSAALPTTGRTISPMKVRFMFRVATTSSMVPTRYSAQVAMRRETPKRTAMAIVGERVASSCCSASLVAFEVPRSGFSSKRLE